MLNLIGELKLNSSVISISILKDYILMMDNFYNVYLVDKENFKLLKNIKLMRVDETLHEYTNALASSSDGFIVSPDKKLDSLLTFQLEDDFFINKLATLSWHTLKIEVSKFSKDSKYLATGGADGKVFIFQFPQIELLTSLPNRPDFISAIDFSHNNRLITTSCYDKTVTVFDLKRNIRVRVFRTKGVIESLKFFDHSKKIFFVTRDGTSGIYDVIENEVKYLNNHFNSWPSCIAISEDEKFAIVGSRRNSIYAVRLEDNVKVLDVNVESSGISKIQIYKESIIVGFIDGSVQIFDFNKHLDELKTLLDKNKFKEAKQILKKNIFLTIHPYYKKFDDVWPEILEKAIKLLMDEKIDEAVELVEPFVDDPKKEEQFTIYLVKKDLVKEFLELIEKENYKNAYLLLQNKQYLLHTEAYKKLENKWLSTFNKAKKLLEEDANLNKKMAQEMLKPFMVVEEKESLAKSLLINPTIFKTAEDYIKRQNFKAYFDLIKKYPFLKDTELYQKTTNLANTLLAKMVDLENQENFEEARNIAKTLISFATHAQLVKARVSVMEKKKKMIIAIENKRYNEVYSAVIEDPALSSLSEFQNLEDKFNIMFEDALEFAFKGNPQDVLSNIGGYLKLEYWHDKVASILKVGYIQEFKNYKTRHGINWEESVKNYIIRYGIDGEIEKVCQEIEKMEFLEKFSEIANPIGHKNQVLFDSLLVFEP